MTSLRFCRLTRFGLRASLVLAFGMAACSPEDYTWAFARDLSGSVKRDEFCRQSLAEVIYAPNSQERLTRGTGSNVFVYRGSVETYEIWAYRNQAECEAALTAAASR